MDWDKFNTNGDSKNHAFEVMCNILFEKWCGRKYGENIKSFFYVNGRGGDGGVEAHCDLKDGRVIAIQSKWFPELLGDSQFNQIYDSFSTAIRVRPEIKKYIVCLPRDLTSKRLGKGKKVTKNSEKDKWEKLLERCQILNPNVEVILWSETVILSEMQRPESVGLSKYWFDNSEIIEERFDTALNKVVKSWGSTNYVPEVYLLGQIHEGLAKHLNDNEIIKKRQSLLLRALNDLGKLVSSLKDVIKVISDNELISDINEDIDTINRLIAEFSNIKQVIDSGEEYTNSIDFSLGIKCTADKFENHNCSFKKYYHFREVIKNLERTEDSLIECYKVIRKEKRNTLIILGNPGTGKTSGIVNEAMCYFKNKRHLPLLISAKRVENNKNWKDIITDALGISNNWDENELFHALSAAALMRYRSISQNEDVIVKPKVIICVDGIDESREKEFWINKIDEAKTFERYFPEIKFVFLSRTHHLVINKF